MNNNNICSGHDISYLTRDWVPGKSAKDPPAAAHVTQLSIVEIWKMQKHSGSTMSVERMKEKEEKHRVLKWSSTEIYGYSSPLLRGEGGTLI